MVTVFFLDSYRKSANQMFYEPKVESVGFCSKAPAGPIWNIFYNILIA